MNPDCKQRRKRDDQRTPFPAPREHSLDHFLPGSAARKRNLLRDELFESKPASRVLHELLPMKKRIGSFL